MFSSFVPYEICGSKQVGTVVSGIFTEVILFFLHDDKSGTTSATQRSNIRIFEKNRPFVI